MNAIFRGLVMVGCWLLGYGWLAAAEVGYIRVVPVLIQGEGPVRVTMDGRCLRQAGHDYGQVTGTLVVEAGRHAVRVERDGVLAAEGPLEVLPGRVTGLVIHGEKVEAPVQEAGGWRIRVTPVMLEPAAGRRMLQLVSVMPDVSVVAVKRSGARWRDLLVRPLQVVVMPVQQNRGYLRLAHRGRRLGSVAVEAEGNHVVVIHDDGSGRPAVVSYVERKAWLPVPD